LAWLLAACSLAANVTEKIKHLSWTQIAKTGTHDETEGASLVTALAGKTFLAANITEKSSTYHANCISNTQNRQNRKPS
jgi:hypothetical protein